LHDIFLKLWHNTLACLTKAKIYALVDFFRQGKCPFERADVTNLPILVFLTGSRCIALHNYARKCLIKFVQRVVIECDHRYLRQVDCSRHHSLQKKHFKKSTRSSLIDKTRHVGRVNEQSTKIRQAGWVSVFTLTKNIVAAATNRTNIDNKTLDRHYEPSISLVDEMSTRLF